MVHMFHFVEPMDLHMKHGRRFDTAEAKYCKMCILLLYQHKWDN